MCEEWGDGVEVGCVSGCGCVGAFVDAHGLYVLFCTGIKWACFVGKHSKRKAFFHSAFS